MKKMSKSEAKKKIEDFFEKKSFSSEQMRKIKRRAMHHNIKLGKFRALACKKCYTNLRDGKVRVTGTHKIIECSNCRFRNKIKM